MTNKSKANVVKNYTRKNWKQMKIEGETGEKGMVEDFINPSPFILASAKSTDL